MILKIQEQVDIFMILTIRTQLEFPDDYSSWEEWWRDGVTSFVSAMHDSVQSVKPYVRLSAAVLGRYNWGGWQGYSTVYQDGALWFNEGFVDQLMPMHYHWTSPNSFFRC